MRRVSRWAAGLVACAALAAPLARAASTGEGPAVSAEDLARVGASLERGAFTEAITQLELWSDQGVLHPDLSFDRGVAYLGRAESPARRRADFGQAIAAFEEAASLDPSDEEASLIVERIRTSLSERRAKRANDGVVARPRLMRALLDLVGENAWAGLGLVGALALTLGLAVRLWAQAHRARLAGGIASVVGLACAALGASMAFAGHRLRVQAAPAVVIVEEARLQDAEGHPFSGARGASTLGEASDRVPEGTLVHISASRGALVQIEWGDSEAWLDGRAVRRLAVVPPGMVD
jgi:ElaB/YqjD/DUF883 family membrane-anchored ribosome-binding protein